MKRSTVLLAAGTGVAAVTFSSVFLSGCGAVGGCYDARTGKNDLCGPYDAASEAADATLNFGDASDAETDSASDAGSDAPADAATDASGDAPVDAPEGG
jgi:hypothetical protein